MKNLVFVLLATFASQSFAANYTCVDSNNDSFLIVIFKKVDKETAKIYKKMNERLALAYGKTSVSSPINGVVTVTLETPTKVDWSKTPEKICAVEAAPWVYFQLNTNDLSDSKVSVQKHFVVNPDVEHCTVPPVQRPESHPLVCKKN